MLDTLKYHYISTIKLNKVKVSFKRNDAISPKDSARETPSVQYLYFIVDVYIYIYIYIYDMI